MLNITVVQPSYFADENPDEAIAQFLIEQLNGVMPGGLIVLPEYSNAGGLSDAESEMNALFRAKIMLKEASVIAQKNSAYVAINVLECRNDRIKNSTYLFDKEGKVAFIYDKQHLPPSEIILGYASVFAVNLDILRFYGIIILIISLKCERRKNERYFNIFLPPRRWAFHQKRFWIL